MLLDSIDCGKTEEQLQMEIAKKQKEIDELQVAIVSHFDNPVVRSTLIPFPYTVDSR